MQIIITDAPDEAGRKGVITAMDTHNAAFADPAPARGLRVLLRDPATGAVLGGMYGVTYWEWLSLRLVYLPEAARGQGLGRRMLRAMEQAALRHGCRGVWVDSYDFEAPGFYRAAGYEAFAALDERGGHRRHWFRKLPVPGASDMEATESAIAAMSGPDADIAVLEHGQRAGRAAVLGAAAPPPLGLLLRDPVTQAYAGGLLARPECNWLFIDLLALPEAARRGGLGSRLMALAEQEALARGLMGVWLDTFTFQARPFYERLGYQMFGQLDEYPAGHSRFFLAKRLDGGPVVS